jgi:hypothetical protein
MTTTSKRTVYTLANMAEVAGPDSPTSPGAEWLQQVADDYDEAVAYSGGPGLDADEISERADANVPVYTNHRWKVFTDLAAWTVEDEIGGDGDMTDQAGRILYQIAERLMWAIEREDHEDS